MWLANSKPLNARNIEEQLRLLRTSPLINDVTASLRPTGEVGKSLLIVTIEAAQALTFEASTDNFSPPIIGSERIGGKLEYRNLLGFGDTITGTYNHTTTGESDTFDLNYNIPLNAMEGTLQLRTFISRSEFDQQVTLPIISEGQISLESFEVELNSDYEIYSLNYRQPIIRSLREELAVSGGFTYRDGSPIEALQASGLPVILAEFFAEVGLDTGLQAIGVLGPDLNQDRTSVFNLGVDYVSRDPEGVWALSSQFNVGTGIFDATIRPSPFADSRFFSWLFQAQRLQQIGTDNLLIMVGSLQLSPDSLLSSQQFVIGGGQSIRGFRQNVRFGDNGFRFSIEDRITVARNGEGNSVFQVAPFLDLGQVWNNPDNQDLLRNKTFLGGLGFGLIFTPINNLSIRVDFALPLVDLEDRGENVQEEAVYFDVKYRL
ncbi:ShlB/FhaC/HecB family hemolysin secretion/activation protein [Crocosphaera sp.]|uniref:ShlB/FhaC/HecB family hemolysin secretion/activation protein n=1 Tax=Crocosphaera sp. TaxID=2729996 RepID=UPI00260DC27E|nr:ShlB/FhaC/HecB family hemolysin secretion/activation protein [Crocosphaera sp.]MDJ0583214.1 ShlB/FhaC/HecB family hemolysin secretion/activation protein [Crocosphaera sp.]